MHTEKREDPLVEMGYEIRDAKVSLIGKFSLYFFIFVGLMIGTGWVVLFGLKIGPNQIIPGMNMAYANKQSGYNEIRRVPEEPNPILQTNVSARVDMMDLRQREGSRLKTTGYLDSSRTRVHIPIDRAMDPLVNGGLPPSQDVSAESKGNTDGAMNVDSTESADAAMDRMKAAESAAVSEHGEIGHSEKPAESHEGHNHAPGEGH